MSTEPGHYAKSGQPALEELTGEYTAPEALCPLAVLSNHLPEGAMEGDWKVIWRAIGSWFTVALIDELNKLIYFSYRFLPFLSCSLLHTICSLLPQNVNKSLTCWQIIF